MRDECAYLLALLQALSFIPNNFKILPLHLIFGIPASSRFTICNRCPPSIFHPSCFVFSLIPYLITLAKGEGIVFGSVCLFVCLCLCLSAQNFHVFFFSVTASWIETIFTIGVTTHVECLSQNYDVTGHVVVSAMLEKRKNWISVSENRTKEKHRNLAHGTYSWGISDFFNDVIGAFVMMSYLHM